MFTARLIVRYLLQRKLRLVVTLFGMTAAIAAFGLLRSVVDAWDEHTGTPATARIVTHSAATLSNTLPLAHWDAIRRLDGIEAVTHVHWFNASFRDSREFFPKFAVDGPSYLAVYPEIHVAAGERAAFLADRSGCLIGRRLAARHGLATGDTMTLSAGKFGGLWRFTVRGVFESDTPQQEWQMLFHWSLLNETLKARTRAHGDQVGAYVTRIRDAASTEALARRIDLLFVNAPDATWSEAENSFLLGFLYSTEAVFGVVSALSLLVVATILLVISNTMLLAARERYREYATLKAMGFGPVFITGLVAGESVAIALLGGALGAALTFPLTRGFERLSGGLLPAVPVDLGTLLLQMAVALGIGIAGSALPALVISRRRVVDSLRAVG